MKTFFRTCLATSGALALALGLAVAAQASAQVPLKGARASAPAASVASPVKKSTSPFGAVVSSGVLSTKLTAQECAALGGTVLNSLYDICNGGQYCQRHDQQGQSHYVCIKEK